MKEVLLVMLGSIYGATRPTDPEDGTPVPNWEAFDDPAWYHGLSSGERARIWLGFQLYNGSSVMDEWTLHSALAHLDAEGVDAFMDAVVLATGR